MKHPRLGSLLPECPPRWQDTLASDMTLDSRTVSQGAIFCAVPGANTDGRQYIAKSLSAGAIVVLAEAEGLAHEWRQHERVLAISGLRARLPDLAKTFFGDPSRYMGVITVTGTNGKTSITQFAAQILRTLGVQAGTIGTLGANTTHALSDATNTTPDVLSVQRQLALWAASGVDHVALEASSHALDQGRLSGVAIDVGVFSNLSRDHLDYHKTMDHYLASKLRLFTDFPLKQAIFNADDAQAAMVRSRSLCPSVGISLQSAEADIFVQYKMLPGGTSLRIHGPEGSRDCVVGVMGHFNVFNVVAAIRAVTALGYPYMEVVAAAEQLQPVVGRMEVLNRSEGPRVVVDYAHTPDALERALDALRPTTSGALWVVFGCGGDRDKGKRALMGAVAEARADRVVVTSDNPRRESPTVIIEHICQGMVGVCDRVVDRGEAIRFALSSAAPADTVLIAGKGHEDYQEIDGVRYAFSDKGFVQTLAAGGSR